MIKISEAQWEMEMNFEMVKLSAWVAGNCRGGGEKTSRAWHPAIFVTLTLARAACVVQATSVPEGDERCRGNVNSGASRRGGGVGAVEARVSAGEDGALLKK